MGPEIAPDEPSPRAGHLALAFILIVAAALRVSALDKPFYVDEMTTITVASQPLESMARVMRLIDASPALYPLLLHGWLTVGHHDAWVRLLSAIFGFLAVVVVWKIVAREFGSRAGLLAAAVMAISPGHVHYSQYVRSYSLFTLLAALHVGLVVEWSRSASRPGPGRFAAIVLVTTAMLYTHYLSLLLVATTGVFMLWRYRRSARVVVPWVAAMAACGVLFLPGVPLLQHNVTFDRVRNADRPDPPPFRELAPTLVAELGAGQRSLGFGDPVVRRTTLIAAALLLPGLAAIGFLRGWRIAPASVILLAAVAIVPPVLYVGSGRRLVAVRFFLPFMVGYLGLIGIGLSSLRRWRAIAAGVAVVAIAAVPLTHYYARHTWSYDHRSVALAIGGASRPGDALVTVHPFETLYYRWYLGDTMPIEGLVFTPLEEQETYVIKPPPLDLERAREKVQHVAARHPRFWVVGQTTRSFASDAADEALLLEWLDSHFERIADLDRLTGGDPHIRLYGTLRSMARVAPR